MVQTPAAGDGLDSHDEWRPGRPDTAFRPIQYRWSVGPPAVMPSSQRWTYGRAMRRPLVVAGTVLVLTCPLLVTTPALADRYDPGSPSGGDPYFPAAGNGGYEIGRASGWGRGLISV